MKITLNQDPSWPETEVIINCPQADEDILRLVALLRVFQKKLVGIRDGERRLLKRPVEAVCAAMLWVVEDAGGEFIDFELRGVVKQ